MAADVYATELKMDADGAVVSVTIESDLLSVQLAIPIGVKDGDSRPALQTAATTVARFARELLDAADRGPLRLRKQIRPLPSSDQPTKPSDQPPQKN